VISCRTLAAMSLVSPWLMLVLAGGCASLVRPIIAEGLVMPTIRRFTHPDGQARSSS